MATAFVLGGGGSLGSIQVGMLIALAEREIAPDLLVGTSVGAVNAGWVAGHPGLAGAHHLADVWRSVRRQDIFPARPITALFAVAGRRDHVVPADRLRALLRRHLAYQRLEDAPVPLRVVATELTTGLEVVLSRGDAVDAIAASAALPGVFPPVRIGRHDLVDGGVANNTPISHALDAGASTIYVLPTGYACSLPAAPRSALGVTLQAVTLLVQGRLIADVARYQDSVDLHVLPPLCPLAVAPIDFGHTADLIERARRETGAWLDAPHHGRDQSAWLSLHRHEVARATGVADDKDVAQRQS